MKIENLKVVKAVYEMYIADENGTEQMYEKTTEETPLMWCQGERMMLPAFEAAMAGKKAGDTFDFVIPFAEAYGPYEEEGVMQLNKKIFFNGDGEFDSERVFVGNIIPMNTTDGQIINAQVIEITEDKVTIDLNHPYAGEDLHFVGTILEVRDVTEEELQQIRHPKCNGHCGGCHGHNEGEHECCGNGKHNEGEHECCGQGEGKGECCGKH